MGKSKSIGTAAESAVVKAATELGVDGRRVVLAGAQDQGDVHLFDGEVVVEIKAGQQTLKPSWSQIRAWHNEARVECARAGGKLPLLVLKRHGSGNAKDFFTYWRHDDLAEYMGQDPIPGAESVLVSSRFEESIRIITGIRERK